MISQSQGRQSAAFPAELYLAIRDEYLEGRKTLKELVLAHGLNLPQMMNLVRNIGSELRLEARLSVARAAVDVATAVRLLGEQAPILARQSVSEFRDCRIELAKAVELLQSMQTARDVSIARNERLMAPGQSYEDAVSQALAAKKRNGRAVRSRGVDAAV